MGSKNLKAVAVRGTGAVSLSDPEDFKEFHKKLLKDMKSYFKVNPDLLKKYGTTKGIWGKSIIGRLPTKNFQYSEFENWKDTALEMGFCEVASGPFVRSYYHAHELYQAMGSIKLT